MDEKSDANYGLFLKNFENNLNHANKIDINLKNQKIQSKKITPSKSNEINIDLQLNKINEEIKEKIIPKFKNQFKLNKYLIRDFKIGEVSNHKQNSKNKMLMTEDLINYKNNQRNMMSQMKGENQFCLNSNYKRQNSLLEKFRNNMHEFKMRNQLHELEKEGKDLDEQLKVSQNINLHKN